MAHRILLSGGGTGGHLYPALNLAAALRRAAPDAQLMLVGARRGIEASVLPDSGWPYRLLPLEPLYRSRPWRNWRLMSSLPAVVAGLGRIFADLKPDLVVGTGGYASGPAVAWAASRGTRTALQEQNAMPGLVTRVLSSRVDQVHLGYPEARSRIRPGRSTRVFEFGNPVAVGEAANPFDWPKGRVVVAFGGSQGALVLNELLMEGLESVVDWPADVTVVWISGKAHHDSVAARVLECRWASRIRVVPFIQDLGAQLGGVRLAVCRSGAMTCAELAAFGVPALLVPLPSSAGDHQRYNAAAFVASGAALMREEGAVSGRDLWRDVFAILDDEARLVAMARASRERGRPAAADRIASELLRLADGSSGRKDD